MEKKNSSRNYIYDAIRFIAVTPHPDNRQKHFHRRRNHPGNPQPLHLFWRKTSGTMHSSMSARVTTAGDAVPMAGIAGMAAHFIWV